MASLPPPSKRQVARAVSDETKLPVDVCGIMAEYLEPLITATTRLRRLWTTGREVFAPYGEDGICGITGVTVRPRDGAIIASDFHSERVVALDASTGKFLDVIASRGSEPGQVLNPDGLAVTPRGELVVVDSGNHRVQVLDVSETGRTRVVRCLAGLPNPGDVAVDSRGRIIVTDHNTCQVSVFSEDGRRQLNFGLRTPAGGYMSQVHVAVICDDLILISAACPRLGPRLQLFDRNGEHETGIYFGVDHASDRYVPSGMCAVPDEPSLIAVVDWDYQCVAILDLSGCTASVVRVDTSFICPSAVFVSRGMLLVGDESGVTALAIEN
jgi:hypothetical protein